jgi:predicted phosphoribosyltransferase
MRFRDRAHAGRFLGEQLGKYAERSDVIVVGLPRGGVPVAYEIARTLGLPMDIFLVRKLGVPGREELAMGAIGSGGVTVINHEVTDMLGITQPVIDAAAARERQEIERRDLMYRGGRPVPDFSGKTVIVTDDGLATGSTMLAAVRALRRQGVDRIVAAVPVAAPETCAAVAAEVDEIVCAMRPHGFTAVSLWYDDFSQTTDREVQDLLEQAFRSDPRRRI